MTYFFLFVLTFSDSWPNHEEHLSLCCDKITVYTQKSLPLVFLVRWTKLFWIDVLQQRIKQSDPNHFQTYLHHFTCFHFFFLL